MTKKPTTNSQPSSASHLGTRPGTPPDSEKTLAAFDELCRVIAKLRSPEGCPWDRVQTLESIKPHTLEETYELLDAIDSGDDEHIVEELGDVLLQVVLDAQIGADESRFSIVDVITNLNEKLIRRHPHVFGNESAETPEDVKQHWDKAKSQEKEKQSRQSKLDGLPKDLPALAKAARLQEKAAKVGYDFPHRDMLFEKLSEELTELKTELYDQNSTASFVESSTKFPAMPIQIDAPHTPDKAVENAERKDRIEDEMGDVLFVLANVARRWKINPEQALRRTNQKFTRRFQAIENGLQRNGSDINHATLAEMEEQYQLEKQREKLKSQEQ